MDNTKYKKINCGDPNSHIRNFVFLDRIDSNGCDKTVKKIVLSKSSNQKNE